MMLLYFALPLALGIVNELATNRYNRRSRVGMSVGSVPEKRQPSYGSSWGSGGVPSKQISDGTKTLRLWVS